MAAPLLPSDRPTVSANWPRAASSCLGDPRRRTLLRGVDRAGALETEQRVVDVAGDDQVDAAEPLAHLAEPRQVGHRHLGERGAAAGQRLGRAGPQHREQPGARIVGGAAHPGRRRSGGRLRPRRELRSSSPDTPAAREGRVALVGRQQVQPGRLGGLDVCRPAGVAVDDEDRCGHRSSQRVADRRDDDLAADRRGHASRKPGPPSDSGRIVSSSWGAASRQPAATASAAWVAVSVPENESGAMSTRMSEF